MATLPAAGALHAGAAGAVPRVGVSVTPAASAPQPAPAEAEPVLLEPGWRNRLYLALRSGIPSEVDWALERLAYFSVHFENRLLLSDYPGLGAALVDYLRRLCDALEDKPRAEWDASFEYSFDADQELVTPGGYLLDQGSVDSVIARHTAERALGVTKRRKVAPSGFDTQYHADAVLLRRALECALILRNLCLNPRNVQPTTQISGLLPVVYGLLRAALSGNQDLGDLAVHMFEILESLAQRIQVGEWSRTFYTNGTSDAQQKLEDKVFELVYNTLQTTDDRALLLSSLRCMSSFALNDANHAAFIETDAFLQPNKLGLTARCLALLPLTQDPDLIDAAVDLLYQVVSTGDNALLLGTMTVDDVSGEHYSSSLKGQGSEAFVNAVVGYLVRNLNAGKTVWERDTPLSTNLNAWWNSFVPSAARARKRAERERRERLDRVAPHARAAARRLRPHESANIRALPEPQRGIEWMKLLYESSPNSEVTQMEFWITYRDEFTADEGKGGAPLQPAATLIRNVSQVFPGAAAMVIPAVGGAQPRFIIRGIANRARDDPRLVCEWEACPDRLVPTREALRAHVDTHIGLADRDCRWAHCTFSAASRGELHRHAVTHIPTASVPHGAPSPGTQDNPGTLTFEVERTPSLPGDTRVPPSPYGTAFMSLLILRFITRTAAETLDYAGVGCPGYTYGGRIASSKSSRDRDQLFGCPFASLLEESPQESNAPADERGVEAARHIMNAVARAEDVLVQTALCNDILCQFVNDTLVAIRPVDME
ncbi:hypothetical protein MCUN1_001905 [Malassezia cuniculi]|uniref:RFX-type winged-helix domain-containing protein n=1 Tax=Malassezia cuniculi TaxID=948313 RepID=A0AAF0EUV8_9BASI|nr:hypothetical protein MCUN1_001905 [Malassezia cuniculi]